MYRLRLDHGLLNFLKSCEVVAVVDDGSFIIGGSSKRGIGDCSC